MTLTLTPEQEAALERSVRSGRFASKEEAVDAAFATLQEPAQVSLSEKARLLHEKYPTLYDLMQASPFRDLDIEFPRDRTPLRDIEL
jgi:Arc/MetJ-type ribon-helix-helix transcriptional regulator